MANQILINNEPKFISAPYPIETEPSIFARKMALNGYNRDVIRITVEASYADVAEAFTNNVIWGIRQPDIDEEGNILETYHDYDYSNYCVAGDVVDHRNGTVTVYMGTKTAEELEVEALTATVDNLLLEVVALLVIEGGSINDERETVGRKHRGYGVL